MFRMGAATARRLELDLFLWGECGSPGYTPPAVGPVAFLYCPALSSTKQEATAVVGRLRPWEWLLPCCWVSLAPNTCAQWCEAVVPRAHTPMWAGWPGKHLIAGRARLHERPSKHPKTTFHSTGGVQKMRGLPCRLNGTKHKLRIRKGY